MKHNPVVRPSNTQSTAGHGSKATDRVQQCGLTCPDHRTTQLHPSQSEQNYQHLSNLKKKRCEVQGWSFGRCQERRVLTVRSSKRGNPLAQASKQVKMWLMIRFSVEPQCFTCRPLNMGQTLRILPTVGQRH